MKDFKNYTPENNDKDKIPQNVNDINSAVEFAKSISQSMNGKSEGQLLRSIIAEAERGKRNGTLTNEQIDAFYAQFSMMLDGAKRKKLQKIVEQLKRM